MSNPIRQRVKLWLRSDQALGLSSEPVILQAGAAPGSGHPATPAASSSRRPPAVAPAPSRAQPPAPSASAARTPATTAGGEAFFDENAPFASPVPSHDQKLQILAELDAGSVKGCTRCVLCQKRTNTVFGEGDIDARLMFIGEGPGEEEDRQGRPFVGRAGQKLNEMISAMGLKREQVYIANVVKCRPPDNRAPAPDEMETCFPYLLRQVEVIRPQVIVLLGLTATRAVLRQKGTMSSMRGRWHDFRGIRVMPTFHPSYILRNYTADTRRMVWSDLQKVMAELGLPNPRSHHGAE